MSTCTPSRLFQLLMVCSLGSCHVILQLIQVSSSYLSKPHSDRTSASNMNAFYANRFGLITFDTPLFASDATSRGTTVDHDATLGKAKTVKTREVFLRLKTPVLLPFCLLVLTAV